MQTFFQKHKWPILGMIQVLCALCLIGSVTYGLYRWYQLTTFQKARDANELQVTDALARQLGYANTNSLVVHQACTYLSPFCHTDIEFRTMLSIEEVRTAVGKLGLVQASAREEEANNAVMDLLAPITENGHRHDGQPGLPKAKEWGWSLHDQQGQSFGITFFDIVHSAGIFALDGVPLHSNIMAVSLYTKHPLPWSRDFWAR